MSHKKSRWLGIALPLSLGVALSMAFNAKDKNQDDTIQAPETTGQTTFTLAHTYDTDANVSIETSTRLGSCKKVMEYIHYDHGSGKKEQQRFTTSSCFNFFQGRGNEALGRKYFVPTLTASQRQDRARLAGIYNTLEKHAPVTSVINCDKPAGQATLTCTVTPL